MTTPLVSILIRSMGRDELSDALTSVKFQHWPNIEIVIVDASGKESVSPPPAPGRPLRLLRTDRALNRSEAANLLLDSADGEFALFLDDDDWIAPDHIERLMAALVPLPSHALSYAGVLCVEQDAHGDLAAHGLRWRMVRRYDAPFDAERLMAENYIPLHAALFRLAPVRSQPELRFDPALDVFEDWDFWLQLLEVGPFIHVPGVSGYYRIHGDAGMGVQTGDEASALRNLEILLSKWIQRWDIARIRNFVGWSRQISTLRDELEQQRRAARDAELAFEAERAALKTRHAQELDATRQWYEHSRSWRLTRPLRGTADLLRRWSGDLRHNEGRRRLARMALNGLTRLYRSPVLAPLSRAIPPQLKRRIRNRLIRESTPTTLDVWHETGLRIERPIGPTPLVSIVIPVYNHADYIEHCIRSALAQDWPNLEVIVVDDASTDPAVLPILNALAADPRCTLIRHEHNKGISEAQNSALIASQGDIIAFLDCDDHLAPDAVSRCMRAWRADTVYLHSGRINVDDEDREVSRINFVSLPREDYFEENLRAMYATHFKLIRRDAFARVGLFDPRFDAAQDYEMLMRIAFHYPSRCFVHVPDFVYFHRFHALQTTEARRAHQDALTTRIQREARLRDDIRRGRYGRKLSFIMLSFGKHSQTLQAIKGIEQTVRVAHEIILYDNGSDEDTVAFLKSRIDGQFENVRVIYGDRNLGPAQGRRRALEHASGEWFIVFDNDEIPEAGWLEELLVRAESRDRVGAVCCRVAFPNGLLQFSGGFTRKLDDVEIELALHDRDTRHDALESCIFREIEWAPIGATLFTVNIAEHLHDGYPNVFEDAGVSFALRKRGYKLLNAPGALVWHEHVTFRPDTEMRGRYLSDRYDPELMLKSVASFHAENGLLIRDEYIWRENGLDTLSRTEIIARLEETLRRATVFKS